MQASARDIRYAITALSLLLVAALLFSAQSRAEDVDLGRHNAWQAHSWTEDGARVCNMWSRPTSHEEQGRPRGDIYAFVTHRPGANLANEVSLEMGYPIEQGSDVTVTIGDRSWRFYTDGSGAFARTRDQPEIVQAMRRGRDMRVEGRSTRGTPTRDTYSLMGFTAAHNAITGACSG